MEPHWQALATRLNAPVGRPPDHKMAHSSTAKTVVFSCRDKYLNIIIHETLIRHRMAHRGASSSISALPSWGKLIYNDS